MLKWQLVFLLVNMDSKRKIITPNERINCLIDKAKSCQLDLLEEISRYLLLSEKSNKTVVSTTLLAGLNFPKLFLGMFNYYS